MIQFLSRWWPITVLIELRDEHVEIAAEQAS